MIVIKNDTIYIIHNARTDTYLGKHGTWSFDRDKSKVFFDMDEVNEACSKYADCNNLYAYAVHKSQWMPA